MRQQSKMLAKRIIPCLDVTAGRVVKGVNFVNLRDAGDPVELADRYNQQQHSQDLKGKKVLCVKQYSQLASDIGIDGHL